MWWSLTQDFRFFCVIGAALVQEAGSNYHLPKQNVFLFFNLFENYNQANLWFQISQIGPTHNFDSNNQ